MTMSILTWYTQLMSTLLLPSLELVRELAQIPPGYTTSELVRPERIRPFPEFAPCIKKRSERDTPLPDDIERAMQLAKAVNHTFDGEVRIDTSKTIENSPWQRLQHPVIITSLCIMSRLYHRAKTKRYLPTHYTTASMPAQLTAEHLVGRALAPSFRAKPPRGHEPTLFYNPLEIGKLRSEFGAPHITDGNFISALSRTALRKYTTRNFLAALYDTKYVDAHSVHGLFLQSAYDEKGNPLEGTF